MHRVAMDLDARAAVCTILSPLHVRRLETFINLSSSPMNSRVLLSRKLSKGSLAIFLLPKSRLATSGTLEAYRYFEIRNEGAGQLSLLLARGIRAASWCSPSTVSSVSRSLHGGNQASSLGKIASP